VAPRENGNGAPVTPNRSPERRDRPRSQSKSGYETPQPPSRKREGSRPRGPPVNTNTATQTPKKPVTDGKPASTPKAAPTPAPAPDLTVTSPGTGSPEEKKTRSLLKKLRAIDDLKMRQAGGEKLEGTQVLKIGTEEQVRKELNALGYSE